MLILIAAGLQIRLSAKRHNDKNETPMFDFNHYDPMPSVQMSEAYRDLTPEQQEEVATKTALYGCGTYVLAFILAIALCALFGSCTTPKVITDTSEQRHTQEMLQQMDSLLRVKTVTQQDSTWQQEILRQFQSIRESSDTSHSVTLNAAGDTIRERIVINNLRERTSETDREQLTVMSHRLEVMDSTVQAQSLMLSRMDSLLRQQRQTEIKEVPAKLNWFQQMTLWLGRLVLVALALCAGWFVLRWWLRVKKVI